MFYDRFARLCAEKGVSPSRAAIEAGLSKSTVTKWKTTPDSKPTGAAIDKLTVYFGISISDLFGEESDDNQAITSASHALSEMLSASPDAPSKDRLKLLFEVSDFDIDIVCFNLGIDQSIFESWLCHGNLPPRPVVDKIMGVFHIQPHQLLNRSELDVYHSELSEWGREIKSAPAECGKGDILDEVDVAFYGDFKELSEDDKEIVRSMVTAMRQRRGKI